MSAVIGSVESARPDSYPGPRAGRTKVAVLESMRGIAALAVAMAHFKVPLFLGIDNLLDRSYLAVDFFFVLSGYVMALNYAGSIQDMGSLRLFLGRRFFRLYPLHFALLMAFFSLECAKYVFENLSGVTAGSPAFTSNDLTAFAFHLVLLNAWLPSEGTFNGPSWSISVEFYTYLVFAVIVLMFRRRLFAVATLAVIVSVTALILSGQGAIPSGGYLMFRCTYSFFLGVIAYGITRRMVPAPKIGSVATALVMIACLVLMLAPSNGSLYLLIVPFGFVAVILACVWGSQGNAMVALLGNRWLVYLGTISYSVYMVHTLVWWVVSQVLRFLLHVPMTIDESGATVLDVSPVFGALLMVAGLLAILIVSRFTFIYIEQRFRLV